MQMLINKYVVDYGHFVASIIVWNRRHYNILCFNVPVNKYLKEPVELTKRLEQQLNGSATADTSRDNSQE